MDLHKQVSLYDDKFNLGLNGKKINECITIIRDNCPRLHDDEELRDLALRIEEEYGFKALRLYIYDTVKDDLLQSYTGKDRLQEKYEKLLDEVKNFHNSFRDEELELTLDVYLYYKILEEVYNQEYGCLKDWHNHLYSIMKTIHISNYDKKVIGSLKHYINVALTMANGKYYLKQDLTDPKILHMLYEHIAEESFDEEVIIDSMDIFKKYDGYGNEYWIHDYSESWTDEEGWYHYRSWDKESTIEDYNKVGLPVK
jgi:hypothetical protein